MGTEIISPRHSQAKNFNMLISLLQYIEAVRYIALSCSDTKYI